MKYSLQLVDIIMNELRVLKSTAAYV